MDTLRKFKNDLETKLRDMLGSGNSFAANVVTANILVGSVMVIMIILQMLCVVLNEVGVFSAPRASVWWGVGISLCVQIPITALNSRFRGDKKWLKNVLLLGLLIQCSVLAATLGHNVTLVLILPALLSIRYFDRKLTRTVYILSFVEMILSTLLCSLFSIVNLNTVPVAPGTELTVVTTLRAAVEQQLTRDGAFLWHVFVNECLPKLIIFTLIGFAVIRITERGRELIDIQTKIVSKSSRIETELDLATKIQTGMLPCVFPAFPEFCQLDLFARNRTAKEVGGDFYDYFKIDSDHIGFLIADVSGKGVGAALFMMIAKTVIKNQLMSGIGPAAALTAANAQLCENNEVQLFVTVWAGEYEISTGKLRFANAGHNPPILWRRGGEPEYLRSHAGLVIAAMEGFRYKENELELRAGDLLFLYTDGVTEATDGKEELYGEERLLKCIRGHEKESMESLISCVLSDVDAFVGDEEQFDDITMLSIRVN